MENVLLIVHLILAVFLIGVVLLQRSEGGALGIGGGGGGGMVSSRGATTALAKVTWGLAAAFIATSLALTIIAAQQSGSRSVIHRIEPEAEISMFEKLGRMAPPPGGFAWLQSHPALEDRIAAIRERHRRWDSGEPENITDSRG